MFPIDNSYIERLKGYRDDWQERCKTIKGEERFYNDYILREGKSMKKIKRQVLLYRNIFDFRWGEMGIRIEIDGKHHNTIGKKRSDKIRDRFLFERFGVLTLRVNDFDDNRAEEVVSVVLTEKVKMYKRLNIVKKHILGKSLEEIGDKIRKNSNGDNVSKVIMQWRNYITAKERMALDKYIQ